MSRLIASASLFLLLTSVGEALAVAPAGTTITLTAGAGYVDALAVPREAEPALRNLTVVQVAGVQVQCTAYTGEVGPGQTVNVATRVVNTGNAPDGFCLAVETPADWSARVFYDSDDDGVRQEYDDALMSTTGAMVQGGYVPCLVEITTPTQPSPAGTVTLRATSTFDTSVSGTAAINLTMADAPVVQVSSPTTDAEFYRNCPTLHLAGTAMDFSGVASVRWDNETLGTSGQCNLNGSDWFVTGISLRPGENIIVVTARDIEGFEAGVELRVSYIDASPGDAWKGLSMVSLPIIPDETDPKLAVAFDQDYWLGFNTATNSYVRYPDHQTFLDPPETARLRGFWTHFSGQEPTPAGTILKRTDPVAIRVKPGWNLIGQPFIEPFSWDADEVMVQRPGYAAKTLRASGGLVSGFAWGWRQSPGNYDTGSYYLVCDPSIIAGAQQDMQPWQAYWVYALQECDLILSPPSQ